MSAGRYSFVIEQGSTLNLELQYRDSNGNPIDLTDYSGRMQIRPSPGSPTLYITLSSSLQPDGTGLVLGGVSGTINIVISAATSSALTFSSGSYDLELTSGSVVTRLIQGTAFVNKEVTR